MQVCKAIREQRQLRGASGSQTFGLTCERSMIDSKVNQMHGSCSSTLPTQVTPADNESCIEMAQNETCVGSI